MNSRIQKYLFTHRPVNKVEFFKFLGVLVQHFVSVVQFTNSEKNRQVQRSEIKKKKVFGLDTVEFSIFFPGKFTCDKE